MRILFIRHAEAVEADEFPGRDLDRPLTPKGQRAFQRMARMLAGNYDPPRCILTSEAKRARATAEILSEAFGSGPATVAPALNPGATLTSYLNSLPGGGWKKKGLMVVVGHEPDLGKAVARLVGASKARIKLVKGACAEVEWTGARAGVLRALLNPAWARR